MPLHLKTHLAGAFKYPDGKALLNRTAVGDALFLKREPTNPYDDNAIQVFAKDGDSEVLCGYIPRTDAATLKDKILLGAKRDEQWDWLTVFIEGDEPEQKAA